ncbi:virus-induced RNA 1 [Musca autumnalis]|uniref:virus-induced RNA 1 n=1 Tax=Musca autumnalis TaxID=221902 RepID=UPI003CF67ED0
MKNFIGLFVVTLLAVNGVLSLPARNPSDDAEVIGYPRRVSTKAETDDDDKDYKDFKGVIDTGYPFLQPNPSVINFGFFDSFDDIFRRFSSRFWPHSLLGHGDDDSDEDSGSSTFGISSNLDPKKGNTTSTVKVIDGHKVVVNETVYGDEHSVFKVRVVNVRPLEEGETVEETVRTGGGDGDDNSDNNPVTSSPATNKQNNKESVEDDNEDDDDRREPLAKKPNDNEIERNIDDPEHLNIVKENIVDTTTTKVSLQEAQDEEEHTTMLPTNIEEMNFVVDNSIGEEHGGEEEELNNNGNGNNEFETNMSSSAIDGGATIENNEDTEDVNDNLNESSSLNNAEESSDKRNEFDSSDDEDDEDVKHSNYVAAGIRNKPREDISSSDDEDEGNADDLHPTFYDEWGSAPNGQIDVNKENNDLSNDIDVYDVEPVDLSNDIAVNDAPDLPLNPDAEFIDVFGGKQKLATMPKFEKLSLSQTPDDDGDAEHLSSFSGEMK